MKCGRYNNSLLRTYAVEHNDNIYCGNRVASSSYSSSSPPRPPPASSVCDADCSIITETYYIP
jgi:hypothetical protein